MSHSDAPPPGSWPVALFGLWLATAAAFALTGPGRIDIIDGIIRYIVSEGWYERGDSVISLESKTAVGAVDPSDGLIFNVFPGRDGVLYTPYRIPQTVLGVGAIWLADRLGPRDDGRRHFLFSLTSALAGGLAAVGLADWFRQSGMAPRAAVGWAAAGALTTPVWYYATSSFDDILGTAGVAVGYALARRAGAGPGWGWAAAAGLAGLWVVNCKPPLAVLAAGMFAAADAPGRNWRHRVGVLAVMAAGFAAGVVLYKWYEWVKYPPGTDWLPEYIERYGPMWTPNPVFGLVSFLAAPGAAFWIYCPPAVLGLAGLVAGPGDRRTRWAAAAGVVGFTWCIAHLTFFKGPPGWGPRYLTPAFAVLFLYAPAGAARVTRRPARQILAAGAVVQLLGLSVDPWRLHLDQKIPSSHYLIVPWTYFLPQFSDLPQRPVQIATILRNPPPIQYSLTDNPADPTPAMYYSQVTRLQARYYYLGGFRPWVLAYRHLPADRRPLPYWPTVGGLAAAGGFGIWLANRGSGGRPTLPIPPGSGS